MARARWIFLLLLLALGLSACRPVPRVLGPAASPTRTPAPALGAKAQVLITPAAQATVTPGPLPTRVISLPMVSSGVNPTPTRLPGNAGERTIHDAYIPYLGNTSYDVQAYILRLALDPAEGLWVEGHVTLQILSTLDDLVEFSLDFVSFRILEITLDGEPVRYQREGDKLVIFPNQPLADGQPFELDVTYRGQPLRRSSAYLPFVNHLGLFLGSSTGTIFALSEPDGARFWFPCNDHPRDKAVFRFELAVPEGITAAANGLLAEHTAGVPDLLPDGRTGDLYVWEHNAPMATYLATVVVGDYRLVEGVSPGGVPLRSYAYPESEEMLTELTPLIGEMVDWMSARLGPYPFEVLGFAEIEPVGAALETQTLIITPSMDENTMAHEIAHQWFGNWVSLDSWGEIWRNEGFATYFAALWETRDDPDDMELIVSQWRRLTNAGPPLLNPPPSEMFDLNSYWGGAVVAYELHQEIGDEAFFAGLRSYFERYGGGVASEEQFQAEMEAAAGRPLDEFFQSRLVGP